MEPARTRSRDALVQGAGDGDCTGSVGRIPFSLARRREQRPGREEIKEVILQSMIYAGAPAANTAMKHAAEVIAEIGC
jgi:hypothetical protein